MQKLILNSKKAKINIKFKKAKTYIKVIDYFFIFL